MPCVSGDYKMICDRCGGTFLHSEMREEWTGLWVCTRGCFEEEHPQDFVEAVDDDPTVSVARPDVTPKMGETTLNGAVIQWAKTLILTSASGLVEDDPIGIVLDNGTEHWTFLTADPVVNTVAINDGLPWAAASGNVVHKPSVDNETWV